MRPIATTTFIRKIFGRRAQRRRIAGGLLLAAFGLGLAHGWLHFAGSGDHKHFAQTANEFCIAEKQAAASPPVITAPSPPQYVPVRYVIANGHELCGCPPAKGYSPRDPPVA
jgi:hypothetical protein